jgi:hypothetical protein
MHIISSAEPRREVCTAGLARGEGDDPVRFGELRKA